MSNSFIHNRNKVLFEALMNPKFHREKKNFVLKEDEDFEAANLPDSTAQTTAAAGKEGNRSRLEVDQQTAIDSLADQISSIKDEVDDCRRPKIHSMDYKETQKETNRCRYMVVRYDDLVQRLDNILIDPTEKFLDVINTALDVIGIFEPTGIADFSNMILYIGRNKFLDAFFSLLGAAIPYIGDMFKFAGVVGESLLKDALRKLFQSPRGLTVLRNILSWVSTKGQKGKEFADWVYSFIFKNDLDLITRSIFKKETSKAIEQIINKKMVEASSAWSLRGQKAMFKEHPFLKSLEVAIAAHVVDSSAQKAFTTKKRQIIQQLQLIKQEYEKKAEEIAGTGPLTSGGVTEELEATYSKIIGATQMLYLLDCTNRDTQLIGAILSEYDFSTTWYIDAEKIIKSALNMNIITSKQAQEILETRNKILKGYENKEKPKEEEQGFFINLWQKIGKFLGSIDEAEKVALARKQIIQRNYMPQLKNAIQLYLQSLK